MEPVPSNVTKTYPQRGPLQQFRFAESTAFRCFRCGDTKKSKLITVYAGDWSKRLCNGCYGRLLSLYEIKAGTRADDERAEELAAALLSAVALDDQRQAERVYRTSEKRAERLSSEAVRFIATAEHVAGQLQAMPQLEWSPAVIGLCKAVEAEVVSRILVPLADKAGGADLSGDKNDKDIGRVAAFCADPTRKPPALGAFAHFLQTVIHSQQRRDTSALIRTFLRLAADWTGSNWLLDPTAFHHSLTMLTTNFRNRAAHIDELGREDYLGCRELVIGTQGVVWRLLVATERHR
jgi:hypothetical protein